VRGRQAPAASLPAALFLFFSVLALSTALAQVRVDEVWYASDPSGFRLERIPGPVGLTWALLVSRDGLSERSVLYKDGKEKKTLTRTYGPGGALVREAEEENGIIREEMVYDADGRPATERRFLDGGIVEEVSFGYESGRLRRKTTSAGGTVLGTVEYLYAPDGRLASAIESTGESWGNSVATAGLSRSWRVSGDLVELRGYDGDGRLVSISKYAGTSHLMEERRFWLEGDLERSVVTADDGTTTTKSYVTDGAARGEPWSVIVEKGGNEQGKLSRLEQDDGGSLSVMEYQYDEKGTLSLERRFAEASLAAVVRYGEPGSRVEEAWDRGALYARVYWKDGRKVLEEIIKDGVVVRSRSFE